MYSYRAFTLAHRALTAAKLGFPLKIHADEFENLGGASSLAVPHRLTTWLRHQKMTSIKWTVNGGSSPCTPFGWQNEVHPGKTILTRRSVVIATDINRHSGAESMQFVLACLPLLLTPAGDCRHRVTLLPSAQCSIGS